MTLQRINFKITILLLAILAFASCKTTKNVTTTSEGTKSVSSLVEKILKAEPQFTTANVNKMSIAVEMAGRNVNANATCKVRKDSLIHLSIQPFMGIELFKAELTPDSIRVFDKMNNKFYLLDYNFFAEKFNLKVDFYSLQSLIFGQLFCVGEKELDIKKLSLSKNNAGQKRLFFENVDMQQYSDVTNDFNLQQVLLKSKSNDYELKTNYSNYVVENGVSFPAKISLNANNQKHTVACDFSILRVEFNSPLKFQATNPGRYSKGDIEQLLKK